MIKHVRILSLAVSLQVALVAFGVRPTSAQRPDSVVLLRLAPPVGQVSHYRMVDEMILHGRTMRQTFYFTIRIQGADGDLRRGTLVVDSVQVDVPDPEGFTDSLEILLKALRATMTVTSRGEVLSLNFDESAMPADFLELLPPVRDALAGIPYELPEDPVHPGATWTLPVERSMPLPGSFWLGRQVRAEPTYRFDRLEVRDGARHAIISVTGTVVTHPQEGAFFTQRGQLSGEMDLDLDVGRMVSMTLATEQLGTVLNEQWALVGQAPIKDMAAFERRVERPDEPAGMPLYVVDGVVVDAQTIDIDALDIQNIDVIQGKAAVVLYGEDAANGVVSFTTGRPRDAGPIAAMKADLRDLLNAQELYFADSGTYTNDLGELTNFRASPGIQITISSAGRGWSATARHENTSVTCYVLVGVIEAPLEGMEGIGEGTLLCRRP